MTRYCLKDASEVNKLYIATSLKRVKNNLEFIAEVIVKSFFFQTLTIESIMSSKIKTNLIVSFFKEEIKINPILGLRRSSLLNVKSLFFKHLQVSASGPPN